MRRGGDIKKVNDLLDRYKKILVAPQKTIINTFCRVLEEDLGIILDTTAVRYNVSNKTIHITTPGPKKTEVLLHKETLINKCKEVLGEKNAPQHIA